MVSTTSADSLWLVTAPATAYPRLTRDQTVDVVVVGGGVAGLTAALLLQREGARVAVVEAARVGSGVTGCTTAKVSALQSTIYTAIRQRHGVESVAAYAQASSAGVELVASLVDEIGIECGLQRRAAVTYAATPHDRRAIDRELQTCAEAGLPVYGVDDVALPYEVHGAVVLDDQVQIHPVQYVQGLAAALVAEGGHVFENSRVTAVRDGRPCHVRTANGELRAERVVVATHFPILDRGVYFARLRPQRSYCIAVEVASGLAELPMAISADSPTRSIRAHRDTDSNSSTLVIGGEGHPPGAGRATPERYARLEEFARTHWDVQSVTHRWSAQDATHYDHLPVIGPYHPATSRIWVAAGFMKWGFSSAGFAAQILADAFADRPNPFAATFAPSRVSPRSLHEIAELGVKFSAHIVTDRVRPAAFRDSNSLDAGAAAVVGSGPRRRGVYRDEAGALHAVSLRCTHQGCLLRFNSAETSWDCPCHGSRFGVDGEVLEGPAVRPLDRREP
jgi:glycine/D-amino acid oxidase-like deaminating enzyme/nitrite reductase/ring-hydroxylating ferredoxin subunit